MNQATTLLLQYARYHRDPRNIATHAVGIPMIVLAVCMFLSRWHLQLGSFALGAHVLAWLLASLWYLTRGNLPLGLATSAAIGVLVLLGGPVGQTGQGFWLTTSVAVFVAGWALQFIGHYWEGRKPAFVDDLRGLLVGPMFVVAEAGFRLGLGAALHATIEAQAGPVVRRGVAHG